MAENKRLREAFVDLQKDLPVSIEKTGTNPFFKSKYVTLDHLMEVVRPIINRHGFGLVQSVGHTETGEPTLDTRLGYKDGGAIKTSMLLMSKSTDPQAQGSAITYARRYSLMALLGVTGDEDDDANAAQPKAQDKIAQSNQGGSYTPSDFATDPQKRALMNVVKGFSKGNITTDESAKVAIREITGYQMSELPRAETSALIKEITTTKKVPLEFDEPENKDVENKEES